MLGMVLQGIVLCSNSIQCTCKVQCSSVMSCTVVQWYCRVLRRKVLVMRSQFGFVVYRNCVVVYSVLLFRQCNAT